MERLKYDNRSVALNQTKPTVRIFGLLNFPGNILMSCIWVLLKKYGLYKYPVIRTKMSDLVEDIALVIPAQFWPLILKRIFSYINRLCSF